MDYFVNDASTVDDVYCTATGTNGVGRGTNAASPALTLSHILTTYTISPGDRIFIDSGNYTNESATFTSSHAGTSGNPVLVQGSTNQTGQRTVYSRNSPTSILNFNANADFIRLRHIELRYATEGLLLNGNNNCTFEWVTALRCTNAFRAQGTSTGHRFFNCLAYSNSLAFEVGSNWRVDNCTLFQNTRHFSQVSGTGGSISNSIVIGGTLFADVVLPGDYNVFWNTTLRAGQIAFIDQLQANTTAHTFSVYANPQLPSSNFSFRLPSIGGRFDPVTSSYVTDAVHSIAIDIGNPTSLLYTNEPAPNGGRLNVGLFGGAPDSSKSQTNEWLFCLSYNDGGSVTTQAVFRWVASSSFTNGGTVRIDFSPDDEASWATLATNIPATNAQYTWTGAGAYTSLVAHWRVVKESNTNVWDANDSHFVVRNGSFNLFVNDDSTNGDVYCTAIGDATNTGLSAASPLPTIQSVLNLYDLGPGDVVYVDAGVYTNATAINFVNAGVSTNYMVIQGSTNHQSGRTIIRRNGGGDGISLSDGANFIRLRDLYIQRCANAVLLNNAQNCEFEGIVVEGGTAGFVAQGSPNNHRFNRCAVITNSTAFSTAANWKLNRCVMLNNTFAMQVNGTGCNVSNSVIVGGQSFPGDVPKGDFNVFWNTTLKSGTYTTLNSMQKGENSYWQSTYADPLFVLGTNNDLHVRSTAGRYNPNTADFVTDTNNSPCIDLGDPAVLLYTNEPAYNGGRLNAGFHAGTAEASKTPTNGYVMALTYRDGGTLNVGDTIYWVASSPTCSTVRIEFSGSAGASWQVVTSGLAATQGFYVWSSTNFGSSSFARWRVVLECNTNVVSATPNNMQFRNGPFIYYVNDNSTANDVFTTAVGNNTNLGTDAGAPKASLQAIFSTYDLDPGDIVYVDTGRYNISADPPVMLALQSGVATNPVIIQGSTSLAGGGTIFDRGDKTAGNNGFTFSGVNHVRLRNLTVSNANIGVRVLNSSGIQMRRVVAVENVTGVGVESTTGVLLENSEMARNSSAGLSVGAGSSATLDRGVSWQNGSAVSVSGSGLAFISNSAMVVSGSGSYGYLVASNSSVVGDFNNVEITGGGTFAQVTGSGRFLESLGAWVSETARELNSSEFSSDFANPSAYDFHLRTEVFEGRVDPQLGLVSDSTTSPLIDAGNPSAAFSNEPSFNGLRLNIGSHGNHSEASKSPSALRLLAASLRGGGWVKGHASLHWVANNFTNNARVHVQYSLDGGESWVALSNNVLAATERVSWDATSVSNTPAALWRVISASDTNLMDATTNFFAVRNSPLTLFVNDPLTTGDAFCTGPGSATNHMATKNRPIHSLATLLNYVDVEPGDTIYVDTGDYALTANLTITQADAGDPTGEVVRIIGSTNECGAGTVFTRAGTAPNTYGIRIQSASSIVLSNLTVVGGNSAVRLDNAANITLSGIRALNATNGIDLNTVSNVLVSRCVASGNRSAGVVLAGGSAVRVLHSVVLSNNVNGISVASGSLTVSNTHVSASGSSAAALSAAASTSIRSDYNNLYAVNQASVGRIAGVLARNLASWQQRTTNDLRSLSHDPRFAAAGGGDYHPRSSVGRFDPDGCGWVADAAAEHSPLIDAGAPSAPFALEPIPNGGRVNIGIHGNTEYASQSITGSWLRVLSFNDGGSIRGTNALYWDAGGSITGQTVALQFSFDNGNTWTNIATNLLGGLGFYLTWDTSAYPSTPLGRWRVISESDGTLFSTNDLPFTVNNGPITFYVNDSSTNCDVYCTQPGSAANDGLTPASPKASIQQILTAYPMAEGNVILVDVGEYIMSSAVTLDGTVVGSPTNRILIQGSTNEACGGTTLRRPNGSAFLISGTTGISIRCFNIVGPAAGVTVQNAGACDLERVYVSGQSNHISGVYGFEIRTSTNIVMTGCAVQGLTNTAVGVIPSAAVYVNGTGGVLFNHGVLWSNSVAVSLENAGSIRVTNSILGAFRSGAVIFQGSAVQSEFNNILVTNGATIGNTTAPISDTLTAAISLNNLTLWNRYTGNDRRSLSHDPLFADAENGDFHLKSQGGRYDMSGALVFDASTSPMVDAGSPTAAFTNEPLPNGNRVNLGRYGNTSLESRSTTNASLTAVSLNDGGVVSGTNVFLYWVARGAATAMPLRVQYSSDGGTNWVNIASNLVAGTTTFAWNTTNFASSQFGRWRVQSETNVNVVDVSDRLFVLHNSNFVFYINDASTNGDHYCTAIGSSLHHGLSPAFPKAALSDVLSSYDLEAGDTIFVDTGYYSNSTQISWGQADAGDGTNRVTLIGSTNTMAGGSMMEGPGIRLSSSLGVEIRNLELRGHNSFADGVLSINQSTNTRVSFVTTIGGQSGLAANQSPDLRFDHCVARNALSNGLTVANSPNVTFNHGVLWSNNVGVLGVARVSNTVVGAFGSGRSAFSSGGSQSDFNLVFTTNGASIGDSTAAGRHVLQFDPGFINAAEGDFHPVSQAGRYETALGTFQIDPNTSILIDAGGRSAPFTNETAPNGLRANIGVYGNTKEASRTPTNAVVYAASFNAGGTAQGTNVLLYWLARGDATGHLFRVEFSGDAGTTWEILATNQPANPGEYIWNSTLTTSTVLALWRVISQNDSAVQDTNDVVFAVRNGPLTFYVNDGSTNGDIYTSAPGSSTNFGVRPTHPKATLQQILTAYDLEPGDRIYVDTGVYSNNTDTIFVSQDAGSLTNADRVVVQGSTNYAAGGTVFNRLGGAVALAVDSGGGIEIRDIQIRNAQVGLRIQNAPNCLVEWVDVRGGSPGMLVDSASPCTIRRSVVREASTGLRAQATTLTFDNGVLWSNSAETVDLLSGSLTLRHSVLGLFGSGRTAYQLGTEAELSANYNNVFLTNGAIAGARSVAASFPFGFTYINFSRWQRDTGQDRNSLSHEPLFADPSAGDFHLRSEGGRWVVASGTYTQDVVTSPLLDAGDPSFSFANEPEPNGRRIEIGRYGNTVESSLTPTNPSLTAVSLNDAGRAEGNQVQLNWVARGAATGHTVRIEFSPDNRATWQLVTTNVPARSGVYAWNSLSYTSAMLCFWRITSENNPAISDESDRPFALRNTPLNFYVNDNSTNGDVYTTAPGQESFDGLSPSQPKRFPQSILTAYDLEPGDTLWVDTCDQLDSVGISVDRFDAWDNPTNTALVAAGARSLTIQGSTNYAQGGSIIRIDGSGNGVSLNRAWGVVVRDLKLIKAAGISGSGVRVDQSPYVQIERLQCSRWSRAYDINLSDEVSILNSLGQSSTRGLYSQSSQGVVFRNGVLWSNSLGVVQDGAHPSDGSLIVENTSINTFGDGNFGYFHINGVRSYDYNNLFATNGGFIGAVLQAASLGGGTNPLEKTFAWTRFTGQDRHSLSKFPDFANPGAGDFHLLSPAGRFVTGVGFVTNASERISPLLDAGNPATAFSNEPSFNGGRVDIGMYGNTREASKTPSNGVLRLATLNDGFSAFGTVTVYWVISGPAATNTVTLQFSSNGGATWSNITTTTLGSIQQFPWDSIPFGRACAGKLRIISNSQTNLMDTSDQLFALRNGGTIPYYVNATLDACDIYTTAAGNSAFDGCLPATPKPSLQSLLDDVDLEPGDIVYVDSDTYVLSQPVTIGVLDAGSPTNPVVIQGSTNFCCGGSTLTAASGGTLLRLLLTEGVHVRDLRLQGGSVGFAAVESANCVISRVRAQNNSGNGFVVQGSTNLLFENCVSYQNGGVGLVVSGADTKPSVARWNNGVIWSHVIPVTLGALGQLSVRNSALQAVGASGRIYYVGLEGGLFDCDYNNYLRASDALMAERQQTIGGNEVYGKLLDWQRFLGQDAHSLSHEPEFVDAANGDFHLQSMAGSINECGATNYSFVFSPMLDTGDPAGVFTNEPAPNGARLNIGAYGNTKYESLSQTNPWLLAINPNDGGVLRGTQTLYWAAGGFDPTSRVSLLYAADGVDFATVLASNQPVYAGEFVWNLSALPPTVLARWKVVAQDQPGVEDVVDNPFAIKNNILNIYVNDEDLSGDVFCTGLGNATNPGTASQPLNDPAVALATLPFGAGDTLFIDAGTYYLSQPMIIGQIGDTVIRGATGFPFLVQGATGDMPTVIVGAGPSVDGLVIRSTRFIEASHLKVRDSRTGVLVDSVVQTWLRWIDVANCSTNGFVINNGLGAIMEHCSAWANSGKGLVVQGGQSSAIFEHGVVWSNLAGGVESTGSGVLSLNNSVVQAGSNAAAVTLGQATYSGSYNFFEVETNGFVARDTFLNETYSRMQGWQNRGFDTRTVRGDPLFANPSEGDFHLMSQAGRFSSGVIVTDLVTSWAIDAGAPSSDYSLEPQPNGGRVNVGLYGNTPEASRSYSNALDRSLFAVTMDDGGLVGSTQLLYWLGRGFGPGALVNVEFSTNAGQNYVVIGTNLPANSQGFSWVPDPDRFASTPVGLWRVTSVDNTNIFDVVGRFFTLRLGPIFYYVNDSETTGDVYCTAAGSSTNIGLSPGAPRSTLNSILNDYDLDASPPYTADVVYVDSGVYWISNAAQAVTILNGDGGVLENKVRIQGSTNPHARTVYRFADSFTESAGVPAIQLFNADFLAISDITVENAGVGIKVTSFSTDNSFSNITVRDFSGAAGILVDGESHRNSFYHTVVTRGSGVAVRVDNSQVVSFDRSILWRSTPSVMNLTKSIVTVSNSILSSMGSPPVYVLDGLTTLKSDFNNLYLATNIARLANQGGITRDSLLDWTTFSGQDVHSLSVDPLFADEANDDYHLRSFVGRFNPATQSFVTTDTNLSYLVDAGATNVPVANEPAPNGGRMNIGLHGNTVQASKSRTNAWLLAVTGNSGGRGADIITLVWNWGGMDPATPVNLDFSYDNGDTWVMIETNIPVRQGEYRWNTFAYLPLTITPAALWRIQQSANSNVYDITDESFILNGPITFYVNDGVTNNDFYTSAPGNDTNLGFFTYAPKATLRRGLLDWPVRGGDTIQFDVGVFIVSTNDVATLTASDQGTPEEVVTIQGAGGDRSLILWPHPNPGPVGLAINGSHVLVTNLLFQNLGLSAGGTNILLTGLQISTGDVSVLGVSNRVKDVTIQPGSLAVGGQGAQIERVRVGGSISLSGRDTLLRNASARTSTSAGPALSLGGTNATVVNNTIINNGGTAVRLGGAGATVLRNNILIASGAGGDAFVFERVSGALDSDYNNLVARNGAWIGNASGNWERLVYWQQRTAQDRNSISAEPLFANEAGGDLHLRSKAGRYQGGLFILDSTHSPSIDAGDPATSVGEETSPNGSRINQGVYGGTEEASRSLTEGWVIADSLNDGGVVKGTNVVLIWRATPGLSFTNFFTLQYSPDNGATWTNIASGLPATTNRFVWNTTAYTSSLDALWRVLLNGNTGVMDEADAKFSVRNAPLVFYVNDSSTNGDIYATAPGASGNDGRTPATPLPSLFLVLTNYDLEGGDLILLDTGGYTNNFNTRIQWSDGGDPGAPLVIQGSTNVVDGGSTFFRQDSSIGSAGLEILANHVSVRDVAVRNAHWGLYLNSNRHATVERVLARGNVIGIGADRTLDVALRNNRIWGSSSNGIALSNTRSSIVENITFVNNRISGISLASTLNDVLQNNIHYISGSDSNSAFAYLGAASLFDTAFIDYNLYYFTPGSSNVFIQGTFTNLFEWQRTKAHDYRSMVTNPLFADVDAGDFHLQSAAGRYQDGVGFVLDTNSSWAIDRGNPVSAFTNEPAPNGGRINLGAYGNTIYASKGSTNIFFEARSANNNVVLTAAENPWLLLWEAHLIPSGTTVRIEYSGDNGNTWLALATNVSALQEYYIWTLSPLYNTYNQGRWRVVGEQSPFYSDINNGRIDMFFGTYQISQIGLTTNFETFIRWRGAWGEQYQVQYATGLALGQNVLNWSNAPQGSASNELANFISTIGGDFTYVDLHSVSNPAVRRLYRVVREQME